MAYSDKSIELPLKDPDVDAANHAEEHEQEDIDSFITTQQAAPVPYCPLPPKRETRQSSIATTTGNALTRTISSISRVRSDLPLSPPPDGGLRAWLQVLGCHLSITCYWGFIQVWGIFQTYYSTELLRGLPQAQISWIGSVQTTLIFLVGIFSGRLTDAGYFYPVFYTGAFLQVFGIFMTSLASQFWQILLAQGFCFGIGAGLAFTSQTALVSTYFEKKRVVAIALSASGSTTGGLIFPAIVRTLLPQIGFGWTIRVIAFVSLFVNIVAVILLRWRLPPRQTGPWIDFSALRERPFLLAVAGEFFVFWPVYFGFFYVGVFARTVIGLSYTQSISLLMAMIGVGLPSRVIFGLVADRLAGVMNMLIVSLALAAVLLFGWIGVKDEAGLYAFSVLYGIPGGSIQSLTPALWASLTPDIRMRGTRMGMGFSIISLAVLSGPPIAGALIAADGGSFRVAQIWAGVSMTLGCALIISARLAKTGLKLKAKA